MKHLSIVAGLLVAGCAIVTPFEHEPDLVQVPRLLGYYCSEVGPRPALGAVLRGDAREELADIRARTWQTFGEDVWAMVPNREQTDAVIDQGRAACPTTEV